MDIQQSIWDLDAQFYDAHKAITDILMEVYNKLKENKDTWFDGGKPGDFEDFVEKIESEIDQYQKCVSDLEEVLLPPCPFCGGAPIYNRDQSKIVCIFCSASMTNESILNLFLNWFHRRNEKPDDVRHLLELAANVVNRGTHFRRAVFHYLDRHLDKLTEETHRTIHNLLESGAGFYEIIYAVREKMTEWQENQSPQEKHDASRCNEEPKHKPADKAPIFAEYLCPKHSKQVQNMHFHEIANDPLYRRGCVACYREAIWACQEALLLASKAIKDVQACPDGILPDSVAKATEAINGATTTIRLLDE